MIIETDSVYHLFHTGFGLQVNEFNHFCVYLSLCFFSGPTNLGVDLQAHKGTQITIQFEDYSPQFILCKTVTTALSGSPNGLFAMGLAIGK